jgi:hypothetical protein
MLNFFFNTNYSASENFDLNRDYFNYSLDEKKGLKKEKKSKKQKKKKIKEKCCEKYKKGKQCRSCPLKDFI